MKFNLPFWSKLSEGWKQFLVIAAGVQAIWFFIDTPIGIIDGLEFRKQVEGYEWVDKKLFVSQEIAWSFYMNSRLAGHIHKEDCEDSPGVLFNEPIDCSTYDSVEKIIEFHIKNTNLNKEYADFVRNQFEIWDEYYANIRKSKKVYKK